MSEIDFRQKKVHRVPVTNFRFCKPAKPAGPLPPQAGYRDLWRKSCVFAQKCHQNVTVGVGTFFLCKTFFLADRKFGIFGKFNFRQKCIVESVKTLFLAFFGFSEKVTKKTRKCTNFALFCKAKLPAFNEIYTFLKVSEIPGKSRISRISRNFRKFPEISGKFDKNVQKMYKKYKSVTIKITCENICFT